MPWSFQNLLCGFGSNRKGRKTESYTLMDSKQNEFRTTRSSRLRDQHIQSKIQEQTQNEMQNVPHPPDARKSRPSSGRSFRNTRKIKKTYQDEKKNDNNIVTSGGQKYELC